MNFFSHFFLDRARPEPFFLIGVSTPDLLGIYSSRMRIKRLKPLKNEQLMELSEVKLVREGIGRHLLADKLFHSSDFFLNHTQQLSGVFHEDFPGVPRKFFTAHILLELVLDKILITHFPDLTEKYYEQFETIGPVSVKKFTELSLDVILPDYDRFIFDFVQRRNLFLYRDWQYLLSVLESICRRVRIFDLDFLEDGRFRDFLQIYEKELERDYESIFLEIQHQAAAIEAQ